MKVIGLTATAGSELSSLEESYLKDQLKFEIFDSNIKKTAADKIPPESKTIEQFFGPDLDNMGRLLFCERELFEQLAQQYKSTHADANVYENVRNLNQLRSVKAKDLYLVSE